MPTKNLKLSDDPEDMKIVAEWLNYELDKLDQDVSDSVTASETTNDGVNDDKRRKANQATMDIMRRIKPYRDNAFKQLNERNAVETV